MLLSDLTRLDAKLRHHTRCQRHLPLKKMESMLSNPSSFSEVNPVQENIGFGGFCPVALVEGKGLLLPGTAGNEVNHQETKYACSNEERAKRFSKNSSTFCKAAEDFVNTNTCFAELLSSSKQAVEEQPGLAHAIESGIEPHPSQKDHPS